MKKVFIELFRRLDAALTTESSATFTVSATGTSPLSYRWRFNAVNIGGATSASYTRTNAQGSNAGNYTVVVTNLAGSVTSSVATLTILNRPVLLSPQMLTNGTFQCMLSGDPGYNYIIELSTNFAAWTSIATLTNATGQVQFTETNAPSADSRYYRARFTP